MYHNKSWDEDSATLEEMNLPPMMPRPISFFYRARAIKPFRHAARPKKRENDYSIWLLP